MLLKEYMGKLESALTKYQREHNTEEYDYPLKITEDFNQYRYAMILVLKEYIDRYVESDGDIVEIDDETYDIQWDDDIWYHDGTGKFDMVRQEFVRVIMEIMSNDESVYLPSLAWSNHLEHTGGFLLRDHGNWIGLEYKDVDEISQKSLSEVFPEVFR